MNEKTTFQKIIDREIPADIVYEDEHFFAFLDITPITKGHALLITKEPYEWIQDVPDETLGEIFVCSKKIIHAMKKTLGCDFVQVVVEGVGVPHFHIHLIPSKKDTKNAEWNHTSYEEGEQAAYADKIKSLL
jgi:histidine triad (HIT) family protein